MRIITISREFGSGGRELGKRLAENLGIPCYDHEIIDMIAERNGIAFCFVFADDVWGNRLISGWTVWW